MPFELKDLRDIRKRFGITQIDLARKSGVSQSLIAKIESGRLDPTYTKANKILSALEALTSGKELKASEIMTKKILSVKPFDSIKDATRIMKKYEISQLPVMEGGDVVGTVSESAILDALINEKRSFKISEIMSEAPPIIAPNITASIVSSLLKFSPLLIVAEKGKLKGLITKSDLIRKVYV